jgi:hypothetical protein
MNLNRLLPWSTIACVALLACGDDGDTPEPQEEARASILNSPAAAIAASALSDAPGQDFVLARTRVQERVTASQTNSARRLQLGAGRAASVVTDPEVTKTRRLAATALGATLDPAKEADVASTQASIDALLSEVQRIAPQATSCDGLPSGKAEACAIAFLILEVRRSEGVLSPDAGVADAGSDAGPPVGAIACPTRDTTGAREVTGSISASQTWSGKILIKGSVYVSTAQITIDPGTQILMDTDASIYFAYTDSVGLFANGTATNPITICGRVAEKGYWGKITIGDDVTSESYLRNVLIAEGGGSDVALQLDGDITVDNLQVADSGKDGVTAQDFKAGSQLLSVRGAAQYPLVLTKVAALARVPKGGTFTGNTNNQVSLSLSTIDTDVTVPNLGLPYLQQTSLYQNTGNLVIEPGVEWRLKSDVSLNFAYLDASSVNMKGTATAPIRFVPADGNSHWGSIIFEEKVNSNSVLSYVEFTGGGQGRSNAVQLDAPIKLDHVTLSKNTTGLQIAKTGLAPGSTTLKISETAARPIVVDLDGVYSIPTDSVLTGNTIDQVQISPGTFAKSGTIPNLGVPYYINSSIYNGSTVAMTIAAGTNFVLGADVALNLGYYDNTVTAVGTATQPIKFRGEQALPGFWTGIVLGSSTLSNSKFDYIEVDGAGGATNGAALKTEIAVTITNSKFTNSAGYGIDKKREIATDYTLGGNTFTSCALGNVNLH